MATTITCNKCGGKGTINKKNIGRVVCNLCDGTGTIVVAPLPSALGGGK